MEEKKQRKSVFNKIIRIREKQLKWLNENRGSYSMAGKLDEIINFYKINGTPKTKTE